MDSLEAIKIQHQTKPMTIGAHTSYALLHDPKYLVFKLSRYKFVSKMLSGKKVVAEIGCGDAFGAPIVAQTVDWLYCIDIDNKHIKENIERLQEISNIVFVVWDILDSDPTLVSMNAIYAIDVLEHIEQSQEDRFMFNVCRWLEKDGIFIVGVPNKEASRHTRSKIVSSQHINLKDHIELKGLMSNYFENVFMFGMSDEVVHTGFLPMAQYLWAMGVGVK